MGASNKFYLPYKITGKCLWILMLYFLIDRRECKSHKTPGTVGRWASLPSAGKLEIALQWHNIRKVKVIQCTQNLGQHDGLQNILGYSYSYERLIFENLHISNVTKMSKMQHCAAFSCLLSVTIQVMYLLRQEQPLICTFGASLFSTRCGKLRMKMWIFSMSPK